MILQSISGNKCDFYVCGFLDTVSTALETLIHLVYFHISQTPFLNVVKDSVVGFD